jgi:hypothetical protein
MYTRNTVVYGYVTSHNYEVRYWTTGVLQYGPPRYSERMTDNFLISTAYAGRSLISTFSGHWLSRSYTLWYSSKASDRTTEYTQSGNCRYLAYIPS